MSFNNDSIVDPEELLSLDAMALNQQGGLDLFLVVEAGGAATDGEVARTFHDGKPHLGLLGYWVATLQVQQGAHQRYRGASIALNLLRVSDAATGSLFSLLNNGRTDLTVTVQVFRSGGQTASTQLLPVIELICSDARIKQIALYTSPSAQQPCEHLVVSFRALEVKTAQQLANGQRGPVRSCTMTAAA